MDIQQKARISTGRAEANTLRLDKRNLGIRAEPAQLVRYSKSAYACTDNHSMNAPLTFQDVGR